MTYDWYWSALELVGDYGTLTRDHMAALGVHEDEPQPGFYRVPASRPLAGEPDAFIAIWPTPDGLKAAWDGLPYRPVDVWSWCCRYPVSEERYRRAERSGFTHLGAFRAEAQRPKPHIWSNAS